MTLAQSDLRTHTTASCSALYESDTLLLNGKPESLATPRSLACLAELRALRRNVEDADPSAPKLANLRLKIVSRNTFPPAAWLASSAAGFAALIRAVADLYALPNSPSELSRIARQGSGSACRSLFGGYVAWEMGSKADGSDSLAVQVAPAEHWPEMRAVILVASAEKKDVSSTSGMQATVATSALFKERVEKVVPERMRGMEQAGKSRDFESFADLTMKDSNGFHACCLDTHPPIFYMNDASRAAVRVVEEINAQAGRKVAAYTFDAGPNAVVYYLEKDEGLVAGVFRTILGDKEGWQGQRGQSVKAANVPEGVEAASDKLKTGISRGILTGVGEGPIKTDEMLVGEKGETL